MYRIVTEAVTNVVRHADATQCWLRLAVSRGVEVDIVDDGRGVVDHRGAGVGLVAMRERAAELGGRVHVGRASPAGTSVSIRIPASVT